MAAAWRAVLELERLDEDLFLAAGEEGAGGRTFGGQMAAQALRAASLTVAPERPVHALHGFFLRSGRPREALRYEVERIRDGRAFSARTVTAVQEGKPVFQMAASFQREEPGEDWQPPFPAGMPGPQDLRSLPLASVFAREPVFEIRPVRAAEEGASPFAHPFWMRAREPVGEDVGLHACALAYLTDLAVIQAARSPEAARPAMLRVSLDHSIWFHRPVRADRWLLYSMAPQAHIGARGLAHGTVHAVSGELVATVAQEVLFR